MQKRHQESFDGVEFGRGNGMVMREIVDNAPWLAVIAQCLRWSPHLAHEAYVRMRGRYVLAARWSLRRAFTFASIQALFGACRFRMVDAGPPDR
jgi:hypothetical protein